MIKVIGRLCVCVSMPVLSALAGNPLFPTDLERLIQPVQGAVRLESSFDRTGQNHDWFDATKKEHNYWKKLPDGRWMVFDHAGPGVLERMWMAMPPPGGVQFYFDDEEKPRVTCKSIYELFAEGKVAPFVRPLAANFLGGWYSYVPMPYAKRLKIVFDNAPSYLQMTYRTLGKEQKVETFDVSRASADSPALKKCLDRLKEPWKKPYDEGAMKRTTNRKTLAASERFDGAVLQGPGILRGMRLKVSGVDPALGQKVALCVHVDGQKQPNVAVPVNDFFCDSFGFGDTRAFPVGVHDGWRYCWFPMPFSESLRVELVNDCDQPVEIECEADAALGALPAGCLQFFARWHRENPAADTNKSFTILNATGTGHYVGVNLLVNSSEKSIGFLEGDELFAVDGRPHTEYNGTGMEDYFNGAWYFVLGHMGSGPFFGAPYVDDQWGLVQLYRMHVADPVSFEQSACLELEHGTENLGTLDMSCVTFFYATAGTQTNFEPLPKATQRLVRMKPHPYWGRPLDMAMLRSRRAAELHACFPLFEGYGCVKVGSEPGNELSVDIDAPEDGKWNVLMTFGQSPSCGYYRTLLDGQPAKGTTFFCGVPFPVLALTGNMIMVREAQMTKGRHRVTIVSDKNPSPKKPVPGTDEKARMTEKLAGYDILIQAVDLERVGGASRGQ